MKTRKMACLLFVVVLCGVVASSALANTKVIPFRAVPDEGLYVPNEFIVILTQEAGTFDATDYGALGKSGINSVDLLAGKYAVEYMKPQFVRAAERGITSLARHYKVKFDGPHELQAVMDAYAADPSVDHVEPIGIHPINAVPNDYYFDYQWHMNQANDHDIDAPEAWDIWAGDDNIIVAILDTGVRYYHKDLGGANGLPSNPGAARGNMWINTAELNGSSGVDDDGNGYVDDWIGWDWVHDVSTCWSGEDCSTEDNDPRDFNGHGTHCAGNVGMMINDGYGMTGVAGGWNNGSQPVTGNGVKVMACRVGWSGVYVIWEAGYVRMDFCAEAFYYAADNGAKIASCSWGSSNSGGIGTAIDYFLANGGLIFKSAGNDGGQTADYMCGRTDIISVAATDTNDCKADFSTYGTWVDISAPGTGIWSSYHDHDDPNPDYWASIDGTSMSSPLAAGVGALIWSKNPAWTASQVEQQLYDSADDIYGLSCNSSYSGKLGAGRINAYNAVSGGCDVVADFSVDLPTGCAPLTACFTDLSTGPVISWDWDFGDGGTSTAQNPCYEYTNPGTYTVSLTVTSAICSDTETKTDYITVSEAPVADFIADQTSGCATLTVNFTDLSTGNPTSWNWNFGDGGTSTDQNPTYDYTDPGDYTVTLTITNICGVDEEIKVNYIHVDPPCGVKAFALSDIPVKGTVTGDYTNTHTSDDGYEVITERESGGKPANRYSYLEHKWDFNVTSGTSITFYVEAYRPDNSEGDNFSFEYSTDNISFTPLLTVNSATEQMFSAPMPSGISGTVYIRVVDTDQTPGNRSLDAIYVDYMYVESTSGPVPPVADFSGSPTSGPVPLTVNFTDLSSGSPDTWSWDFGDGVGTSAAQHPTYEYTAIGTYTVSLTVTNAYGSDTETKIDYITVTEVGDYMYVYDMVVGRKIAGPNNSGKCTVTIYNNLSQPLEGATVYVTATGPVGGDFDGVTGADGTVYFETGKIKNPSGEWCFEVTNVTHASYTYDSGANNVTKSCESGWVYGSGPHATLIPSKFDLAQNYPNPFNASTVISFSLRDAAHVTLEVYNVAGRKVATLVDSWRDAGTHTASFEASDLASGIYFYRLQTDKLVQTKKMILMK